MRLRTLITALAVPLVALAGCVDGAHEHDHATLMEHASPAPTIDLEVFRDPKAGWNLHIITTGWAWAPMAISTDHRDGEGHGHIYVDGEQVGRVFTDWIHVNGLEAGDHELKVTLNSNAHSQLATGGSPIQDTIWVTEPEAMGGMHGHPPVKNITGEGPAPTVAITEVHEDPATAGGDVHKLALVILTTGWTFAPEHASTDHVPGEGHGHVYLDGVKLGRIYGDAYHIGGVCSGEHTVRVTLNANDHSDVEHGGERIEAVQTFTLEGGTDCESDGDAIDHMEGEHGSLGSGHG